MKGLEKDGSFSSYLLMNTTKGVFILKEKRSFTLRLHNIVKNNSTYGFTYKTHLTVFIKKYYTNFVVEKNI